MGKEGSCTPRVDRSFKLLQSMRVVAGQHTLVVLECGCEYYFYFEISLHGGKKGIIQPQYAFRVGARAFACHNYKMQPVDANCAQVGRSIISFLK